MIEVQNLTTAQVDEQFVRRVIKAALRKEGIRGMISLGVVFIGKGRMQKLNKKYHRKNKVTDVLSFGSGTHFTASPGGGKYLGEIIVCKSIVKKQAAQTGVSQVRELAHVLIHGTFHLLGYEHNDSVKKCEEMHGKEEEVMSSLDL